MKRLVVITIILVLTLLVACPSPVEQAPAKTTEDGSICIIGSESATSDCFVVDKDECTIDWACLVDPEYENSDVVFRFYVYPKGETLNAIKMPRLFFGDVVDFIGSNVIPTDAGEYYIRVEAIGIQCWKLTISS